VTVVAIPATAADLPVPAADLAPIVLPTGDPAPGPPGRPRRGTATVGALVLATADAMVLAAMVATYLSIKAGSSAWPPVGVHVSSYTPTMITITAVMSAFSVQWAVFSIRRQDGRNAAIAMILTLFLGLAMANLEWLAFTRTHFGVKSHPYGALFYLLIGYHLVHLIAAMVLGAVLSFRTMAGHFSTDRHDPLRAGAVVWQYGNAVWFVVVTVLFLLSRHG